MTTTLDDVVAFFSEAEGSLSEKDKKINKLLHVLEFGNLNAVEMTQVAKRLKEVQQERRPIKNLDYLMASMGVSKKKLTQALVSLKKGNKRGGEKMVELTEQFRRGEL